MNFGETFHLQKAAALLCEYSWLAEFHIVDFLLTDYWNKCEEIPESWKSFVTNLCEENYADSLIDLVSFDSAVPTCPVKKFAYDCYRSSFICSNLQVKYNDPKKRRNVKQKKTYEIETLASIIGNLMEENEVRIAVDVGAGQGYLAMELLQSNEGYKVIAVESSDIQVHGTVNRLKERSTMDDRLIIKQVHLDGEESGSDFDSMIFADTKKSEYLMYSLHACGSLSECMIQLFCDPSCKASILFNVACCYNLIDETLPGIHFPMSQSVRNEMKISLTRNMKMVACQSPSRWKMKPQKTRNFLKRHFYRALLEFCVVSDIGAEPAVESLTRVGNIPDADLISFERYATRAFQNMKLQITDISKLVQLHEDKRHLEKALAFMWSMRALLGPVVEAVILADRYHYAKEQLPNAKISLQAVLDPDYSPRNMSLIVIKSPLL